MICDLRKISEPTKKLFNEYQSKLIGTDEQYRYGLCVNGVNEVCLTDFRTMSDIKGNRNIQVEIRKRLREMSK